MKKTKRRLLRSHREHLLQSGLTDETIKAAEISSQTDPRRVAKDLGWAGAGPAPSIAFPVFNRKGQIVMTIHRPDTPHRRANGEQGPKYESPKDQAPRLYFPPLPLVAKRAFIEPSLPILITEGIKKALCVAQTKLVAPIGAQGVNLTHDGPHKEQTGEYRLHPDFMGVAIKKRRALIAFDGGDTSNNVQVILAEARLARMLLDVGASVRLIRIPCKTPGRKVGIDDYLARRTDPISALGKLMQDALPADPFVIAEALTKISDAGTQRRAVDDLLRAPHFLAALHVCDGVVFDLVINVLRRAHITKDSIRQRVDKFAEQLRPPPLQVAGPVSYPEDVQEEAEALLRDPNLVQRFIDDSASDGLVGEEVTAEVLLYTGVSRNMDSPLNVTIKAASSSGKNWVTDHTLDKFPEGDVKKIEGMTPKALYYLKDETGAPSLRGKVVLLTEVHAATEAEYPIRVMQSEKKLTLWVPQKNDEGVIETVERTVEGPAAFITTTTSAELHDENETRTIELTLDESEKQTRKIIKAMASAAAKSMSPADREAKERRRAIYRCAFSKLEGLNPIIPDAEEFANEFETKRIRARRDFGKLLTIAGARAVLFQKQRRVENGQVFVTRDDLEIAQNLTRAIFTDVPPRVARSVAKLRDTFWDASTTSSRQFTPRDAAAVLGTHHHAANKLLGSLQSYDLVKQVEQAKGNQAGVWEVLDPSRPHALPSLGVAASQSLPVRAVQPFAPGEDDEEDSCNAATPKKHPPNEREEMRRRHVAKMNPLRGWRRTAARILTKGVKP